MMTPPRRVRAHRVAAVVTALGLSGALCATAAAQAGKPAPKPKPPPAVPTYSSPIAMSADGKLVWSVNPDDDSVSVIRTDQNKAIKKITVGNEPQGVALDPVGRYAYVVNAAGNSLTVIRITDARPGNFAAAKDGRFGSKGTLVTGSEPWNVVASPDGKRVYVANSGQDTISVLDVATRKLVGDVGLRKSLCNAEDKSRSFQPRGMAITGNSKKLYVTRFLSYVNPGGQQATDTGRSGVVCRLNIQTGAKGVGASVGQADQARFPDHRLQDRQHRRRDPRRHVGVPQPAPEHRHPQQPGLPAEHRRLTVRPAALQRRHAGLRQRHRRRQRQHPDRRERGQVPQPERRRPGARARQEEALLLERLGHRLRQAAGPRRLGRQRPARQGHRRRQRQAELHRRREHHAATST